MSTSSSSSPRLGRRHVALAALAGTGLVATGCTRRGEDSPGLASPAQQEPDRPLVGRALRAEQALVDRIEVTVHHHPTLRKELHAALAVHRAHVRLLSGTVQGGTVQGARPHRSARPSVPGTAGAAVAAVVRSERRLEAAHVATAVRAQSGDFARVLAGMAAAAAQQAAVLSGPVQRAGGGAPG